MKDILTKIINKMKEFNNGLIVPCDFVLIDAIINHLGENPYTSHELNKLLNINDESKIKEILDFLIKEESIRKTDFAGNVNGTVVSSPLYFSINYEEKFLKAIENNGMTIHDLYKYLGYTNEFKIIAIVGKLEPENKIELDELPNGIEAICHDDMINLVKYRRTKSSSTNQKE